MSRWLKILLALIVIGAIVVTNLPKGLRNNNPGNIRTSRDDWEGLADKHDDGEFFIFENPFWGIRALARILINYRARHGIDTIREVIDRYSPQAGDFPGNTEATHTAYISNVSKATGIGPDQRFVIDAALHVLIPAIIRHEIGFNPFTDALISRSISAAKI